MRIAIASDHAAYELKALLAEWLRGEGHEVADLGTNGPESVDYPDYGYALADAVATLKGVDSVATIQFANADIVRHALVGRIVAAYDRKAKPKKS